MLLFSSYCRVYLHCLFVCLFVDFLFTKLVVRQLILQYCENSFFHSGWACFAQSFFVWLYLTRFFLLQSIGLRWILNKLRSDFYTKSKTLGHQCGDLACLQQTIHTILGRDVCFVFSMLLCRYNRRHFENPRCAIVISCFLIGAVCTVLGNKYWWLYNWLYKQLKKQKMTI